MKEGRQEQSDNLEPQRVCSRCGKKLSRYNKTRECFFHRAPHTPPEQLFQRMPRGSDAGAEGASFSRGKRTIPPR